MVERSRSRGIIQLKYYERKRAELASMRPLPARYHFAGELKYLEPGEPSALSEPHSAAIPMPRCEDKKEKPELPAGSSGPYWGFSRRYRKSNSTLV